MGDLMSAATSSRPNMSHPEAKAKGAVLVTGASRRIGAGTAHALAAGGWPVAVNYLSDEAGPRHTVETVETDGGAARRIRAGVAWAAADELFEHVEAEFGPVLALVNNAGVTADGLAIQLDDDSWDGVLQTKGDNDGHRHYHKRSR
jgi:3-oxoacyl-[acyl-carrier protein] reductase